MNLSGSPLDYLFAFLGGVLLSFTPCVYPLIPISIGYIGINAAGSKRKAFVLSLAYVTGVALTYSLLGLIASLTGRIFGAISTHPLAYIATGAIIVLFGLSMLDIFNLTLPNIIKLPGHKKKNYFSTFVLGLASGLIISPCVSPALAAILAYLAAQKNILYGITLLFSFAYGMGLILILAGTFSGVLAGLPRAGKWLAYLKKLAGLIIMSMGMYFIYLGMRR